MTDISVRHDAETGAATIEIRGAEVDDRRFRLHDPYTEKYLTRRGWSKTPSFLPAEATVADGVITIPVGAELARKIVPGTNLVLDQAEGDFQEIVTWTLPVAVPMEDILADAPAKDEHDREPPAGAIAPVVDIPAVEPEKPEAAAAETESAITEPASEPAEAKVAAANAEETAPAEAPLIAGPFEPTIMQEDIDEGARQNATPRLPGDNDNQPSTWKPVAIAALVCLLLGTAIGAVWGSRGGGATSADAAQANASGTAPAVAEKDKTIADLRRQLADAGNRRAAEQRTVKQQKDAAARGQAKETEAQGTQLAALKAELARREASLRDVQAKLSVANVQIDALKLTASKNTEAGMEKTELSQKLSELSAQLDKANRELSQREEALAAADEKLKTAETRLADADTPDAQAAGDDRSAATRAIPAEATNRLQEERDLYASELKKMTASFTELQSRNADLEKTVAALKAPGKDALTTSRTPPAGAWGATAIDSSGAIYSMQNQPDEKAAQDNVNAKCRGKSGSHCETLATFSNSCISVARFEGEQPTTDNYAYFIHKNRKIAAQTALEHCESTGMSCTTRFTACSPDGSAKPISN